MRSPTKKYWSYASIACPILVAAALLHGAYAAGGVWTYLPIAAVWGVCIFVTGKSRESGFIVLYGCLAAILLYRISPPELTELMKAALTEHGLILKVMLISLAVALLTRRDLLNSAVDGERTTPARRRDVFCIIHTFAGYMRRRKRRVGTAPPFPATVFALCLPMFPGVVDPSDSAKTAHGIWTANEYLSEEKYRNVRPGILCCSTLFTLLPFSVWMLTYIYLTGGALFGIELPTKPGAPVVSTIGFGVPGSVLLAMVVPALYGILSYLHGVYLVRRAGFPTWPGEGAAEKNGAENFHAWLRNLGFAILILSVFAFAAASAWFWSAHHGSVKGLGDAIYTISHEIDAWYTYFLVGLIGALLLATALSETLIQDLGLPRTSKEGDLRFLLTEVGRAAPVCFSVFLLFLFYLFQERAIKHAGPSHSVVGTLVLAAIMFVFVTWLAAKPFLVFTLPYLIISSAQEKLDDISSVQEKLDGPEVFVLLQCLLLAAAFCSQFSPQSLGVEYLYGHEVRKWRDVRDATYVKGLCGKSPFVIQSLLLFACILILIVMICVFFPENQAEILR